MLALRRLTRSPGFTLTTVLTLALGIGANIALFSVVYGVLIQPLPYPEPDRLVGVWHTAPGLDFPEVQQGPGTFLTYRDENRTLDNFGVYARRQRTLTGIGDPDTVTALLISQQVLPMLGAVPELGRLFSVDDDTAGSPPTTVIDYKTWQKHFGGDRGIVGRSIDLSGVGHQIIGVLPRGFRVLDLDVDLYVPTAFDPATAYVGQLDYGGVGRLRPGASLEDLAADIERMIPIATERFPGGLELEALREARFGPLIRPLAQDLIGDVTQTLWALLGSVGLMLLLACANVANLFLVRAEARHREIAVRLAIGARRFDLALLFFRDSVLLALLGGGLGIGLAASALSVLRALQPRDLPRLEEITLSAPVLVFGLAISLLTGLVLGLLPALRSGVGSLGDALKDGARSGAGHGRHRTRSALVVIQIAIALVLLIAAGLMLRTFQQLRAVPPGFSDPSSLLTFRLAIPPSEAEDQLEALVIERQIAERLAAIPAVRSVGTTSAFPMDGNMSADGLYAEDHPVPEGQLPPIRRFQWVTPSYFETVGQPLIAGRDLTWTDLEEQRPVVVISRNLAEELWGRAELALGHTVSTRPWANSRSVAREVVGVVSDVRQDGLAEALPKVVYWPSAVLDLWDPGLFVHRTPVYVLRLEPGIEPESVLATAREAVWSVNRNLPLANVRTAEDWMRRSMARITFTLVMLVIAASLSLALGLVGVYAVISYIIAQQTREIGVRMALGATRRDIAAMMTRRGALLVGSGVATGMLAALALTRMLAGQLFGVASTDPTTYGTVALGLWAVAILATLLASRRAASVSPMSAMRTD